MQIKNKSTWQAAAAPAAPAEARGRGQWNEKTWTISTTSMLTKKKEEKKKKKKRSRDDPCTHAPPLEITWLPMKETNIKRCCRMPLDAARCCSMLPGRGKWRVMDGTWSLRLILSFYWPQFNELVHEIKRRIELVWFDRIHGFKFYFFFCLLRFRHGTVQTTNFNTKNAIKKAEFKFKKRIRKRTKSKD